MKTEKFSVGKDTFNFLSILLSLGATWLKIA